MWAIVNPLLKKTQKTEYTTFPEKILRLQIAIPSVCSLDFSYILTCKSVKLRNIGKMYTFVIDIKQKLSGYK